MRLISEITENVEYIQEANGKDLYIEGVFLQADVKNRNGRMYPSKVMEKEVKRYTKEYIDKKDSNRFNIPEDKIDEVAEGIKEHL